MGTSGLDTTRALTVSPEVYAQEIDGECILLDLRSGFYFGLNAVGTRIWALLSEGKSFEEVVAAVEAEFDAPVAVIRDDARDLIEELCAKGLLT